MPRTRTAALAADEADVIALRGGAWPALDQDRGLPQRIADQLADDIIEGRLPSGARLNELEIAAAFRTSRTPVREALYVLERNELVERPPRKGARVAALSAKQALDVYVCRAYLYGISARLAARSFDERGLAELERLADEMAVVAQRDDVAEYYRLNLAFHDLVGRATENEMLLKLMGGMGKVTLRFRYMSLLIPGRTTASAEAHRRLVEALRRRDGAEAERRVHELVGAAGDAVLEHYFDVTDRPVGRAIGELE